MEEAIRLALLLLLLGTAIAVTFMRNVFAAIAVFGIYSFLMASIFSVLKAPDVALTEVVVGAGIATVLMLAALALTKDTRDKVMTRAQIMAGVAFLAVGGLLFYVLMDAPVIGLANAVNNSVVAEHYVQVAPGEIGVPNLVTSVLASYRGYDTLGELAVIFTAASGVLLLLGSARGGQEDAHSTERQLEPIHSHPVARIVSKIIIPIILLFALYVQFFGEYGAGGGFQAGVLVAVGLILYQFLTPYETVERKIPDRILSMLLASGLLLYLLVGVLGILLGGNYLDYMVLASDPHTAQFLGIFTVELGIGISVAAALYSIFRSLSAH